MDKSILNFFVKPGTDVKYINNICSLLKMKNKVYNIYKNLYLKFGDNPASVKARTTKQQQMI